MMRCNETEAKRFQIEVFKCRKSFAYFCVAYCQILSDRGQGGDWVPFRLWPQQRRMAGVLQENRLVVALKARQLGLTWLVLAFALWLLLFHPIATVLLFSRRDDEATDLLAVGLRGMYDHLPAFLKASRFTTDNDHEWALASGSRALAFPTTAGDSYTATLAIVDEADLCPDLGRLLRSVKPTIDGGGQLILLSRPDKSKPDSEFKRIYRGAKAGQNPWHPIFLGWDTRPGRDAAWYEEQRRDILQRTGSLDDLHEQYPATDTEALGARTLDKRIAAQWLDQCYLEMRPLYPLPEDAPSLPGLEVYAPPRPGHRYVVGADPAEGNPTSDDSALEVLDLVTGEQVAALAGRIQPSVFAGYIDQIGLWYNQAPAYVERNNHGHAVLLTLMEHSTLVRLCGLDGREGWLTTAQSKAMLWSLTADACREQAVILHGFATRMQVGSIEGSSLRAPQSEQDDRAIAFALCCAALMIGRMPRSEEETTTQTWRT